MSTEPIDYREEALRCLLVAQERSDYAAAMLREGNTLLAAQVIESGNSWVESARVWASLPRL